jgi:cysteine desulfurase / selenocysteine lyase
MDVSAIRKDFLFFEQKINGRQLIYFDNAATAQKPRQVLNTIRTFYSQYNAAINRSTHELGNAASAMYRQAHENTAKFIGAGSFREIIFVRNATEAINLVCYSLMQSKDKSVRLAQGDEIIIPISEHHSDFVPWQRLKEFANISVKYAGIDKNGVVNIDDIKKHISKRTRLICCSHVSNVLGTINPVKEIGEIVHNTNAFLLVDGTQSAPHMPVNIRDIDCDFFAFSGHKMLGPTGIGVLFGKKELLEKMPPFMSGGGMITDVTPECASWNELPWKFEAGTPDACGAIALAGAIDPNTGMALEGAMDYLLKIGMDNIHKHESMLADYAIEKMSSMSEIILYASQRKIERCGIISFNIIKDGVVVDPNIIANFLSEDGIAVRAGGMCAFPLVKKLSPEGIVRASFYLYNTAQEIDIFIDSLKSIISKKIL